jgi:co-chaperonin GroES (HSP10)
MTITELKTRNFNKSGIYPAGNRVLVFVDQIEDKVKDTLIELLPDTMEAQQTSNASGTLVAVGPDAFSHTTEYVYHVHDHGKELVEERHKGYSEPFAEVGDRISFAKFAGQKYLGKDDKRYLVLNDEDITCRIDPEVELSDLKIRERV